MKTELETLSCNKCGECCRQGGICGLRASSWSLRAIPLTFYGQCELLTEEGMCSVMLAVEKQDGNLESLRKYYGLKGICDFPQLRKEVNENLTVAVPDLCTTVKG